MNIHNILVLSRFHKFWDKLDFSHRSIRKEHTMDTGHPNLGISGGLKAPPLSHQPLWILRCWLLGFPMASVGASVSMLATSLHMKSGDRIQTAILLFLSALVGWNICSVINHWIHSPSQATKYVRLRTVVIRSASPCFSFNPRLGCPTTSVWRCPKGGHLVKNSTRTQTSKFQTFTS